MPCPPRPVKRQAKRPLIDIDWKAVDNLLKAGCTGTEVAAFFDIHPNTFYRRFEDEKGVSFSQGSITKDLAGCAMVRARQFKSAMSGNTKMLELLGKERLRQGQPNSQPPNDSIIETVLDDAKKEGEIASLKEELNELKSQTGTQCISSDEAL